MNAEKLRKLNHVGQDDRYFNRELSLLAFSERVLEESLRDRTPLLERLRFLAICYSNLDEFFMVRMAEKKRASRDGVKSSEDSADRLSTQEALAAIHSKSRSLLEAIYAAYHTQILPRLREHSIQIENFSQLNESQRAGLSQYYRQSVLPVLTPLAVDPAHPFPFLANRRLYLLVIFRSDKRDLENPPIAFVEVPSVLARVIPVAGAGHSFVLLEDLIKENLASLFFGLPILAAFPIRISRNLDINLMESEVVDLMSSVQTEVNAREQAEVVRLEIGSTLPPQLASYLERRFLLGAPDIYIANGPLAIGDLSQQLYDLPGEGWRFEAFNPRLPSCMKSARSIFSLIREDDLLLHHPYESFYAVIELLHAAAWDPQVLAIKQTLYRTSGDSPIIDALIQAAEQGKQVTAVVELKARFDETNNILWARRMERAGVHVVYGFIGLKTHCKMTLIVRREEKHLQRYVHLSTGNYNSATARSYVDLGYITARSEIADDTSLLFNLLTGFNMNSGEESSLKPQLSPMRKFLVAPLFLRESLVQLIDREIEAHQRGGQGQIVAKMNSLVDPVLIEKLYEASQAGVSIQLIIRGICCLRPQIAGMSENIEVISIVGRFLEHSRIFYFHNGGMEDIYLGSADWMQRNMDKRIEVVFPVEGQRAKERILNEILVSYWRDTENSWQLQGDGTYLKREGSEPAWDCQQKFIEIAREQGIKSLPYDKAIRHNLKRHGRPIVKKSNKTKRP